MPGQLSRHSASLSTLPIGRAARSNLRFTVAEDSGSPYSTKSLSSLHPLRQKGKMRAKYNYLDDIEVFTIGLCFVAQQTITTVWSL